MRAYDGRVLPEGTRIAVVVGDAPGNYIVTSRLLDAVKSRNPESDLYVTSGPKTWDLAKANERLAKPIPICEPGVSMMASCDLVICVEQNEEAIELARNLVRPNGFVAGHLEKEVAPPNHGSHSAFWQEPNWADRETLNPYPFVDEHHISALFCVGSHFEAGPFRYKLTVSERAVPAPDVLISAAASLDSKLWTCEKWVDLVKELRAQGYTVGVMGAKPSDQKKNWLGCAHEDAIISRARAYDLRGIGSLPTIPALMRGAKLMLTIDNGLMHLACSVGIPTVGLFRRSICNLWAPPLSTLRALVNDEDQRVADLPMEVVLRACEMMLNPVASRVHA